MHPLRLDLAGFWTRSIQGRAIDTVAVPGGYRPVGECTLTRTFAVPWPIASEQRFFLVTEGVLASAGFCLNDCELGTAGPFCTYRFEIPHNLLRQEGNILQASVKDLTAAFGSTPGRLFEAGFRRVEVRGRDFYLNGERLVHHPQAPCVPRLATEMACW